MPICEPESIEEEDRTLPIQEPESAIVRPPAAAAARPRRRRSPWAFAALLAVACVVVVLAAGVVFYGSAAAAPTRIEPLTFAFQVAPREDHLLLTWNPESKAVRDATGATLTIHDGPESEDVQLDTDALRRGGLDYFPVFENVDFRLAVTDAPSGSVSEQAHASLRP
jgi:hypothetical protein